MASVIFSRQLQMQCRGWKHIAGVLQKPAVNFKSPIPIHCMKSLTTCSSMKFLDKKSDMLLSSQNNKIENSLKRYESTVASPHNHTNHWNAEKALSMFLLGSIPAAVCFPHPGLEYIMAIALTLHSHWGVEAIVVDYIRPKVVGTIIANGAIISVYLLSTLTLAGLFFFIYTDVGLVNAVKMLWML